MRSKDDDVGIYIYIKNARTKGDKENTSFVRVPEGFLYANCSWSDRME